MDLGAEPLLGKEAGGQLPGGSVPPPASAGLTPAAAVDEPGGGGRGCPSPLCRPPALAPAGPLQGGSTPPCDHRPREISTPPLPPPAPRPPEHYVDRRNYVFSRGKRLLAVLTAGNYTAAAPRPAAHSLTGLGQLAGKRLCDALRSGVGTLAQGVGWSTGLGRAEGRAGTECMDAGAPACRLQLLPTALPRLLPPCRSTAWMSRSTAASRWPPHPLTSRWCWCRRTGSRWGGRDRRVQHWAPAGERLPRSLPPSSPAVPTALIAATPAAAGRLLHAHQCPDSAVAAGCGHHAHCAGGGTPHRTACTLCPALLARQVLRPAGRHARGAGHGTLARLALGLPLAPTRRPTQPAGQLHFL